MIVDKENLLADFQEVICVPNLAKSLYHKLREMRSQFREVIEEYQEVMDLIEPKKTVSPPDEPITFELSRADSGWESSVGYETIPRAIFDFIIESDAKPGSIFMKKIVKITENREYEVNFEKHSEDYITGFILKRPDKKLAKLKKEERDKSGQHFQNIGPDDKNRGELVKLLIEYLYSHDDYCRYVISDFLYRWKPLIDAGCLASRG